MKMWKKVVLIIAIVMLVVGLGLLLFPPISNLIGKQISKGQTETFDNRANAVISEGSDADTGVTAKTFQQALERKEVDKQGYPIDKNGNRTRQSPVLFAEDLERLWNDSVAYNEDLKTTQGSRFLDSDSAIYSALDLWSYGACDDIYGYVSAPSIDMALPIYLGASDWNMSYGAAHMNNTSLPIGGKSTNAVVAGHTGYIGRIFFDNIRNLQIGDKVYVRNFWETLVYEVAETYIVAKDESENIFIHKGEDLFTMLTCIPYNGEFGRYIVVCKRFGEAEEPTQTPAAATTAPTTAPVEQTTGQSTEPVTEQPTE